MKKILSIIVPAYNVDKYLDNCLASLCIPDIMDKIEVLVIDDGSTDNTAVIAEKYVGEYPNSFFLFRKQNGGHGSALNLGIKYASAKYIKIVDGDDWVSKDGFIYLVSFLENCSSDMVVTNYTWFDAQTGKIKTDIIQIMQIMYEKEYHFEQIRELFLIKMHSMTVKTALLKENNIKIDEHCFYVDMEYILYPVPYINTITFLNRSVYMYRVGLTSQSVNIQNMVSRTREHSYVLSQLLDFYHQMRAPLCKTQKLKYIEFGVAKMAVSQIKIFLFSPLSNQTFRELKVFDKDMCKNHPEIAKQMNHLVIKMLRYSFYIMYYPIAMLCIVRRRNK